MYVYTVCIQQCRNLFVLGSFEKGSRTDFRKLVFYFKNYGDVRNPQIPYLKSFVVSYNFKLCCRTVVFSLSIINGLGLL